MVKSTENISNIAKENLAAVEQMAKAAEGLVESANNLRREVEKFRI